MREDIAGVGSESTGTTREVLEGWVRERAQELIQGILEEEATDGYECDRNAAPRAGNRHLRRSSRS